MYESICNAPLLQPKQSRGVLIITESYRNLPSPKASPLVTCKD